MVNFVICIGFVFLIILFCRRGDKDAIKRIAVEFCEDSALQGIVYSEVRYAPHLLASKVNNPVFCEEGDLTADEVVEIVNDGLDEGQEKFNIKVRSILCCLRNRPGKSNKAPLDLDRVPTGP